MNTDLYMHFRHPFRRSAGFNALRRIFAIWQIINIWRCILMSEKELQHLYDLLKKVKDEEEKAALRHAIFIIEQYNHVY